MAKRHSLAEDIISGRPLAAVPAPDAKPVDTAPRPRAKRAPAPELERLETVPFRITAKQRRGLVNEAVRRMEARGGGRLDASEVLREVLDAWLEGR